MTQSRKVAVSDFKEIAVLGFQTISGNYREPRLNDASSGEGKSHWVILDQAAAGEHNER